MRITEEHLDRLRAHGYVVVEGFLTPDELEDARQNFNAYYPTWEQFVAGSGQYPHVNAAPDGAVKEGPFDGPLDQMSVHPELISCAERLLGTTDIRLNQSLIWAKYAESSVIDQHLHCDLNDNSLVYPRDDGHFRQIPMMLYYTDVHEGMASTYVVSQDHYRDELIWPHSRTRAEDPVLYAHEVPVLVPAGSLLIYGMRVFHRGSAFHAPAGARWTQHLVWRAAACDWMSFQAWGKVADTPEMTRWLEEISPRQRELLGFPAPGHDYWNEETLAGVSARYPAMDMRPYVRD